MMQKNNFAESVYAAVTKIPHGKVCTYAQVAILANHSGAYRAVGSALHKNPYFGTVPCHRVVSSQGALAKYFGFGGAEEQKRLLEDEGIEVKNLCVDLKKFGAKF